MSEYKGLTHADEHKIIDFEAYKFRKRMAKVQKDFKFVRITDIEFTYSEERMVPITTHWQFWKKWFRKKEVKKL